jgi:hypothetical protein
MRIKRLWILPPRIMLADLLTQHLRGAPWWSLRERSTNYALGQFDAWLYSVGHRRPFPNVLRMAARKQDIARHNTLNTLLFRFMLTPTFRDHHSFRLAGLRRFHTFADAHATSPPNGPSSTNSPSPASMRQRSSTAPPARPTCPISASSTCAPSRSPTSPSHHQTDA